MPDDRRAHYPDTTFILTLVTERPSRIRTTEGDRAILRRVPADACGLCSFDIRAIVLPPEHYHLA